MIGIPYKDTFAAKGSNLHKALTEAHPSIREELAARIYRDTTNRMHALLKGGQDATNPVTPSSAS